jgi:hypothetical protein
MKYSKGIMWLDDCRIPFLNDEGYNYKNGPLGNSFSVGEDPDGKRTEPVESNPLGRFTPNLLVCDDMLNDGIKPNKGHRAKSKVSGYGEFGGGKSEYHGIGEYMEVDSKSRYYDLDKWFDNVIDNL